MKKQVKVAVIGGSAAGLSAASRVRKLRPDWEIMVFERSPHISYAACGMPYLIAGKVQSAKDLVAYEPAFFEKKRNIRIMLRHEVTRIDSGNRSVHVRNLETGEESEYDYEKLLIATGASAVIPPLKGMDLKGVFTLRSLEDGIRVKQYLNAGTVKKALIIGAGNIGMEMAESFTERGAAVTVVERLPNILGNMDGEIAEVVELELKAKGVVLMKSRGVVELVGNGGSVTRALLDDGSSVEADVVLVSVGIRPNSTIAREAAIALGSTGAVRVNERMETNQADIYAAGDCAEAYHLVLRRNVYIPLGTTANKQGRVAGENMGGGDAAFAGIVGTSVFKAFDLEVGRTGLSEREATQEKLDYVAGVTEHRSRAKYCPAGNLIRTKLVADRVTGKVLGAQMAGREGVAQRIGIFATALIAGMTLKDVAGLDLGYSPPLAPVYDPVLIAASELLKEKGE